MCQQFMKLIDIDQVHHRCEHLFTSGTYHSVIGIQQGLLGSEFYSLFYLDFSGQKRSYKHTFAVGNLYREGLL